MAKNRNKSKGNSGSNQAKQPAIQPEKPVTVESLASSRNEDEFLKSKDKLLAQIKQEIANLDKEKEEKKQELEKIQQSIAEIRDEYRPLEERLKESREQLDKAEARRKEEEEKAGTILKEAEGQRLKILVEAEEKAREEYKEIAKTLDERREGLNRQEKELQEKTIELAKEKRNVSFDMEGLAEDKADIQKRKERYNEASPAKIEELNIALSDANDRLDLLRAKYDEQAKKYLEVQTVLDDIEADSETTIKTLLLEFKALKNRNDELERIHEKYPDEESIEELEKAKEQCITLEAKLEDIGRERLRYKEEVAANQTAQKDIEIIRRTAEATKVLNEHLLKELESHKTALESRTGDTCPALTKVDSEVDTVDFRKNIQSRFGSEKLSSLRDIVTHVKNYAGSGMGTEPLYYEEDDIRAFLSGMAVSRLLVLQGMSGTGKSSLPRIFAEAISGFNHLIPVESSWRDRNELLGYYNDFNKKFNAKSFTVELYRSGKEKYRDIPTFIVLDEMNLARIEYYFSDFLAILQEPDSENWLIELHPNDMRTFPADISPDEKEIMRESRRDIFDIWIKKENASKGELDSLINEKEETLLADYLRSKNLLTGAKDLIEGRKVQVFKNTWFIGTANKDESTFEITDKVYDRAQVLSLDKKATPVEYLDVQRKFVSADYLSELFSKAINDFADTNEVKKKLNEFDNLLINRFDMSFGNRIIRQTIEFAAIFVASGGTLENALDYQISTKILRKVLMSDDKDAFAELELVAESYPKTNALIAKRIKDLGAF